MLQHRWFRGESHTPVVAVLTCSNFCYIVAFVWARAKRPGSLILKMLKCITLSTLPEAVEKVSELEKKLCLKSLRWGNVLIKL